MTNLKVSSKFRLFVIISAVLIALGMFMGTLGHFLHNGFFAYGDEFAPYKSIVVRYSSAEHTEDTAKPVCDKIISAEFGNFGYSLSCSDALDGGELVYKFSSHADSAKLQSAADKMNTELNTVVGEGIDKLNVASVREGKAEVGGARSLIFASIAIASASAFMFIYYIFRYKLRAALTALLACAHNLGLLVAIVALVRLPVGAELIAVSALVVLVTMLGCGVFFDRVRKNFKSGKYGDLKRSDVVDISAAESHKTNMVTVLAFMAVAILYYGLASISSLTVALSGVVSVIIGMFSCCYGTIYMIPSVYAKVDGLCEEIKRKQKNKKADGKYKPAVSEKKEA